jgi:hypothetical protein
MSEHLCEFLSPQPLGRFARRVALRQAKSNGGIYSSCPTSWNPDCYDCDDDQQVQHAIITAGALLDRLELGPAFRLEDGTNVYVQGIWASSLRSGPPILPDRGRARICCNPKSAG